MSPDSFLKRRTRGSYFLEWIVLKVKKERMKDGRKLLCLYGESPAFFSIFVLRLKEDMLNQRTIAEVLVKYQGFFMHLYWSN